MDRSQDYTISYPPKPIRLSDEWDYDGDDNAYRVLSRYGDRLVPKTGEPALCRFTNGRTR